MKHIQSFFAREMERNGFGPMTFSLEWASEDRLKLYEVSGKKTSKEYGRNSGWDVFEETRKFLVTQKIDIDKEYVLMLTPLILWNEDGTATEWGPYAGGGSVSSGYAWAFDDALMDSNLLPSQEPGGYFFGRCSKGGFNTKYIGGIVHELGHCFGLPHDGESEKEKKTLGTSLMGGGNHTYGNELRNEGLGTFLSACSAMRLSVCRAFNPKCRADFPKSSWKLKRIEAKMTDGKIVLNGSGDSGIPPIGIIAYNDDKSNSHDYDATTWIGLPDSKGAFRITIEGIKRVPYELRLVTIFQTGEIRTISAEYSNASGTPDFESINTMIQRAEIKSSFKQNDMENAAKIIRSLVKEYPDNEEWRHKAKHLNSLKKPNLNVSLAKIASSKKNVDITTVDVPEAKVGWHFPTRQRVPEDGFIEVAGQFFESGFYAHAPSRYAFLPQKKWKEFKFGMGLQDGHSGSVVFVVRGDDKVLFRSETIKLNEIHRNQVNVSGVEKLELITEDAGDGTANDWGIWIEPQLTR